MARLWLRSIRVTWTAKNGQQTQMQLPVEKARKFWKFLSMVVSWGPEAVVLEIEPMYWVDVVSWLRSQEPPTSGWMRP